MRPFEVLSYFGVGALYTSVAMLILLPFLPSKRWAIAVFPSIFFLFLTQHPFPDPSALNCSDGGARAILKPFTTLDHLRLMWRQNFSSYEILSALVIQAALMNFVLCGVVGAAMSHVVHSIRTAFFYGLGLSLLAEVAQLTGLFGLYPCAYRQFDVDDLILNALGVCTGHMVASSFRSRRSA